MAGWWPMEPMIMTPSYMDFTWNFKSFMCLCHRWELHRFVPIHLQTTSVFSCFLVIGSIVSGLRGNDSLQWTESDNALAKIRAEQTGRILPDNTQSETHHLPIKFPSHTCLSAAFPIIFHPFHPMAGSVSARSPFCPASCVSLTSVSPKGETGANRRLWHIHPWLSHDL